MKIERHTIFSKVVFSTYFDTVKYREVGKKWLFSTGKRLGHNGGFNWPLFIVRECRVMNFLVLLVSKG